jgi:hypothetical protein
MAKEKIVDLLGKLFVETMKTKVANKASTTEAKSGDCGGPANFLHAEYSCS